MASQSITEVPIAYQLTTALSAIGSLLKRRVFVDQVNWKIFPNLSLLLVGPSGIGKDTAIDAVEEVIANLKLLPIISGKTIETVHELMLKAGDPAACYIPAPEITAFLGSKDYQKSMVQELTHLLSTKSYVDVSTKTSLMMDGKKRTITRPTVTLHAGSTEEWLHKAMPEGSMEGGLWPRFLIIYEEYGSKSIPLLKLLPTELREAALAGKERFVEGVVQIVERFREDREIPILPTAAELYENWYRNRFRIFSKTVQPYANRSRDQVLRLAMLCALSRHHDYIDTTDMGFGIDLMHYVAQSIDRVMRPPSKEATIGREILKLLPCNHSTIVKVLGYQYGTTDLQKAEVFLRESGTIRFDKNDNLYHLVQDEDE